MNNSLAPTIGGTRCSQCKKLIAGMPSYESFCSAACEQAYWAELEQEYVPPSGDAPCLGGARATPCQVSLSNSTTLQLDVKGEVACVDCHDMGCWRCERCDCGYFHSGPVNGPMCSFTICN